jgi:hypothetical protein
MDGFTANTKSLGGQSFAYAPVFPAVVPDPEAESEVGGIGGMTAGQAGASTCKKPGGGNRCGHDPEKPRFFVPPESHKGRPLILRRLEGKIRAYFDDPRKTIPSLDLANGKDRQQRSERREACLAVLGCMVHFLDLATLRVGIPTRGGFRGLTVPYLAELSGLGGRRAERAVADLVKAGLITVHPLCQRKDDLTFKGYAAIRTISATVFALFGLGRWLPHEREKAAARLKKKQRKQEAAELAKVKLALGGFADKRKGKPGAPDLETQGGASNPTAPRAGGPKSPLEYLADIKAMLRSKGPPP